MYELIRRIRLAVHVVVEQRAAPAAEHPKGNSTDFWKSRSFLVQLNVSHLLISGTDIVPDAYNSFRRFYEGEAICLSLAVTVAIRS